MTKWLLNVTAFAVNFDTKFKKEHFKIVFKGVFFKGDM